MSTVVIVGSGVAGALVARKLLQSGGDFQITMLEAGPDFRTGDYRMWLDHVMAGRDPYEDFVDDPDSRRGAFNLHGSRLFVKGGTTNHWGGWSLRFKPEDFELKSRTGLGVDWPITYDELSPHYAQAEFLLGVEGDSDNDDPPRHGQKFPFPAAQFTRDDMPMIEALERLDISYSHMPLARRGDRCITTGTCRYCPVDARYNAAYDLQELQKEFGARLEIRTDSPVSEILIDGKRRARGARIVNVKTGTDEVVEGDMVVVCCGTIESTKLLLASDNTDWPDGIGNDSGHVGRHLLGHPLVSAEGARPGNPEKLQRELGFITLACRHFDTPREQPEGKMLFAKENAGQTSLHREILANTSRADINAKIASKIPLRIYASIEQIESPENRVRLGSDADKFGLRGVDIEYVVHEITRRAMETHAKTLEKVLTTAGCPEDSILTDIGGPTGAHATSTCRMSRSDAEGVVDENLRVHGTDNLYVCSNAVFPTVSAVNPTLTVAGLAVRLAEHIEG